MSTGPTYGRQRPGDVPPVEQELRVARAAAEEGRTIVLVEGLSDKAAIDALAKRHGRNLRDEGIKIVAIGGATKIWGFLDLLGPTGSGC
jgi:predicted ATP-dependent endonuclease of OLD family